MEARILAAAGSLALAITLAFASCGGGQSSTEEARRTFSAASAHCKTPSLGGSYARVNLHSSGISCQEAVGMFLVLAGGVSGPQKIDGGPGPAWVCWDLPSSKLPLEVRCEQERRYFTVEQVRRG